MRVLTQSGSVVRNLLRRAVVAGALGIALALGPGAAAQAQERVIGYELGCVDWNAEQGCMEYTACIVYDTGAYNCTSYYRGVHY